jgi:hypothetical protein
MDQNKVSPPDSPALDIRARHIDSDIDVWEPPFERWMKLADSLLTGWVCVNGSVPQARAVKPRLAARES